MIENESRMDYTKPQDIHPAFTLLKGNFTEMKEQADSSVLKAAQYLDNVRNDLSTHKTSFFNEEVANEGVKAFLFAQDARDYVRSLVLILKDAGFSRWNIEEYILSAYTVASSPQLTEDDAKEIFTEIFGRKFDA